MVRGPVHCTICPATEPHEQSDTLQKGNIGIVEQDAEAAVVCHHGVDDLGSLQAQSGPHYDLSHKIPDRLAEGGGALAQVVADVGEDGFCVLADEEMRRRAG